MMADRPVTSTYRETLCRYYEEEIEGEAWFSELAAHVDDPHARNCLLLLAQVERHAADAVLPLIVRHGIAPGDAATLFASGIAAAKDGPKDWAALCTEMRRDFPGYIDEFRALEAIGPPEDRPRLRFLTEHEVAALRFLELEKEGAADSTAPLRRYLNAHPTTGPVS